MFTLLKKKLRVLLLDDDPSMQRLVSALLRRDGYRVDTVLTGRDALNAIAANDYAALLLDLMMPHEGGTTVIKYLRERKPELLRRTIVVTASPESVVLAVARGVAATVQKPFDSGELMKIVRSVAGDR